MVQEVQKVYTPCTDCGSIYLAKTVRSKYDQYWMQFYNTKSQSYPSNLTTLQFAP